MYLQNGNIAVIPCGGRRDTMHYGMKPSKNDFISQIFQTKMVF